METINQKKKYFSSPIFYFLFSISLLFPAVSFASFEGVSSLLGAFGNIIIKLIPIAYGLAILFFFWGIGLYVLRAGDENQAKKGKSIMTYGVIAIFVIASIWGLIHFVGVLIGTEITVQSPSSTSNTNNTSGPCGNGTTGTNANGMINCGF